MLKRIIILLALAGSFLVAPAYGADFHWDKETRGTHPFASNRPDALAWIDMALAPMSVPEGAKQALKEAVKNNPAGTFYEITDGERFEEMQTKGGKLEHDVVAVIRPDDPDFDAARAASKWEITYEGVVYVFILPHRCYNWSWRSQEPPKEAPPPVCAELYVPVEPGDKLTVTILPAGYLPPRSVCSGIKQGDGSWTQQPCLSCLNVTSVGVTLGFDPDAITHEISVCIEREGKGRSCAIVVEPKDWVDKKFTIKPEWLKWSDKCKGTEFPIS